MARRVLCETGVFTPDESRDILEAGRAAGMQSRIQAHRCDRRGHRRVRSVVAACKLPEASANEQSARKTAIPLALRAAPDVSLGVVRLSASALNEAITIATHGHWAAARDVAVAVALTPRGRARGTRLNVEIDVGSILDASNADAIATENVRLAEGAAHAADEVDGLFRDA